MNEVENNSFESMNGHDYVPEKEMNRCSRPRKTRNSCKEELPDLNYELLNAFKIIQHLMSPINKNANWPFIDERKIDGNEAKKPMWLSKVKSQLLEGKYSSITEVVHDVRLILENCYRSYGVGHSLSKRALKLELLLEQKLALLSREIKEKTSLEMTSMSLIRESGISDGRRPPTVLSSDMSQILFYVTNAKAQKVKENKKRKIEEKKAEKKAEYVGVIDWEKQLTEEHFTALKAMWELPQIGHFLFLAQKTLNIPELHMYALERIFLMPRESTYLATIITSLLSSPYQRTKLDRKPPMPYRIWHERLKFRVQNWYKLLYKKQRNARKVFDVFGIEPDFFRVMEPKERTKYIYRGKCPLSVCLSTYCETNPLLKNEFHELSVHQRVWLVKALCDYCLHSHKTIQDAINENPLLDQKEFILGIDKNHKSYVHFPQFCGLDLRIYRQCACNDFSPPNFFINFKSPHKKKKNLSMHHYDCVDGIKNNENIKIHKKHKLKDIHPDINKFELVVDGIESLRQLITELSTDEDGKNLKLMEKVDQPQCEIELCRTLNNLLEELEPWESKLQAVVKRTRVRLKREWDDYKNKSIKEEIVDDIWDSEPDEEQSNSTIFSNNIEEMDYISSPGNESSDEDISYGKQVRRSKRKRFIRTFDNEDEDEYDDYSSEFEVSVSSRGRVRKLRKVNILGEETPEVVMKPNRISPSSSLNSDKANSNFRNTYLTSTSQAQGQYEWETLRQIIVSSNKTDNKQEEQKIQKLSENKLQKIISENQLKQEQSEDNIIMDEGIEFDSEVTVDNAESTDQISKNEEHSFEEAVSVKASQEMNSVDSSFKESVTTVKTESDLISPCSDTTDTLSKFTKPQSVSRMKSSGLFLHIPPRSGTFDAEKPIRNITENKTNESVSVKTLQIEKKQENKTANNTKQLITQASLKNETKNAPLFQIYNFKLPLASSKSTSTNTNTMVRQPQSIQTSPVNLIPVVDQKGNKMYLRCVQGVSLVQTTNSATSTTSSYAANVLSVVPSLAKQNVAVSNSASNVSQHAPLILSNQSNINQATLTVHANASNTKQLINNNTVECIQQTNTTLTTTDGKKIYFKVLPKPKQIDQTAATKILTPQSTTPSVVSDVKKSLVKTVNSSSQSILKSVPPPLGPITSSLRLSTNKLPSTTTETHQISIKSNTPKDPVEISKEMSFLQIPPLAPISLSTSPTPKKSSDALVKTTQMLQPPLMTSHLPNSDISKLCTTSVNHLLPSKCSSTVSVNSQPSIAQTNSITTSCTLPSKLTKPNVQFVMAKPSAAIVPTHIVLQTNNVPSTLPVTSTKPVFFLPQTTLPSATVPIVVQANGSRNTQNVSNMVFKQNNTNNSPMQTLVINPQNTSQDGLMRTIINQSSTLGTSTDDKLVKVSQNRCGHNQPLFLVATNGQLVQMNQIQQSSGSESNKQNLSPVITSTVSASKTENQGVLNVTSSETLPNTATHINVDHVYT